MGYAQKEEETPTRHVADDIDRETAVQRSFKLVNILKETVRSTKLVNSRSAVN
jgi:hypothetical protein